MHTSRPLRKLPARPLVACAALTVVAVAVVALWAAYLSDGSGQTAATLGAAIAVTVAATSGRRSCRPAFLTRSRRSSHR